MILDRFRDGRLFFLLVAGLVFFTGPTGKGIGQPGGGGPPANGGGPPGNGGGGPPSGFLSVPPAQSVTYDQKKGNKVLDKNTRWKIRGNQRESVVVTFESTPFHHVDVNKIDQPVSLSLAMDNSRGWRVRTPNDSSSGDGKAKVWASKERNGKPVVTFHLDVIFVNKGTKPPPEGKYTTTVECMISSAN